jgi:Caspase domain
MGRLPKNKYALLIATTLYKDRDLRQLAAPGADVQALADVLGNPRIGGFEVETLVNKAWWEAQEAIARFFANRDSQDLLLLYFSCHGVKKDDGHFVLRHGRYGQGDASRVCRTG